MRADSLGMFWFDEPPKPKEKKEKVKREPPDRVWEDVDYLPGLEEARRFPVQLYTSEELAQAVKQEQFVFDIEVYYNYFLIAFQGVKSRKVVYTESAAPLGSAYRAELVLELMAWMFQHATIVGFNSLKYDMVMAAIAMTGASTVQLKEASDYIILDNMRPRDVLKHYGAKPIDCDHIDLIEVAPLAAPLKLYGGRLHVPKMQDLPVSPEKMLTEPQVAIVRWYCINDLEQTKRLGDKLAKDIELRVKLGKEYGMDLRSKSDAQIAEAVIGDSLRKLLRKRINKPNIAVGTVYKYDVPRFIRYQTPMMQEVLERVRNANFIVGDNGAIGLPEELAKFQIEIGQAVYKMGIGGLHSQESATYHIANDEYFLADRDVTSYYPKIILNLGLFPAHLGPAFLKVYNAIVERRLHAKRTGDKATADSLKITINGSFGKLGSKYSILYSPHLLIQTTITGQLSLLLLIETFELAGIQVVSANTDGIVVKCKRTMEDVFHQIIAWWERETRFETEETRYAALFSRDVNNYIALKAPGTFNEGDESYKVKGIFAEPGLKKNPQNLICTDAVIAFLEKGTPVETTIRSCTDITRFLTVRKVTGGGVKLYGPQHDETGKRLSPPVEYLGKSIRWYYATDVEGEIVYVKSGNKVPRSEGALPLMQLPDALPQNLDYKWYIGEAYDMLTKLGLPDLRPEKEGLHS